MDRLKAVLVSSEFWTAVALGIGQACVGAGLITQEKFDLIVVPAITYIAARLLGKGAKAVHANLNKETPDA